MLDHAREIADLSRDRTLADLESDRLLELALLRLLEILGESARRVSSEYRAAHPELPWRDVTGMRNWLIHAYDDVNLGIVWRTATQDVPRLVETLERLLR